MTPQFPFKGAYTITQNYDDNFNNYAEGHHGAIDIVPFDSSGRPYPADIYPMFAGKTLNVSNTDPARGKGIRVRSEADSGLVAYLKANKLVPDNYTGKVYIDCLYWHCLEVTDLDGTIDQNTPVAKAGNTGNVYHNGKPVPDSQKGVPPYPGLHLHLDTIVGSPSGPFNLDKDPRGRINPHFILNYKETMTNAYLVKNGSEYAGALPLTAEAALKSFLLNVGIEPPVKADGSLDFDKLPEVIKVVNL